MNFFNELGSFVKKQATDWRMVHEARQKYPNEAVGIAESCERGIVHWFFVSLFVICFAVQGIWEGLWTVEIARNDFLPAVWKVIALVFGFHLFCEFGFKRLIKWRCAGYLLGVCMGASVFAMNSEEIYLFTVSSTIDYLEGIFKIWGCCKFFEFLFGPMCQPPELVKRD